MRPIRTFNVAPSLPPRLEPLRKLAYNLYWDWNSETNELFRRLDMERWESSCHNPVLMLGSLSQKRLQEVAEDEGFLAQMDRAAQQLDTYLSDRTWYRKNRVPVANGQAASQPPQECYAYFSAEFGLTDCLPIYSGGLGVLSGDHLKSASDLGLPLVGVGLLYQEGYFAQYLNADGWQQERYPTNDFYNMPLHLERHPDGSELRIAVNYPGRVVYARVWRVQVGLVPLYLLDTNIEPNNSYDHDITDELYGGDLEMRIDQEIMLGVGGIQALRALGLKPSVFHMNEGHSAFLALERIRIMIEEEGLSFTDAYQVARASQVFTTHTPVPAGIDLFPPDKVIHAIGHYAAIFGLSREEFLALGRQQKGDLTSPFSMAILAIKMASVVNGVSQLHGQVSRAMFQNLWPGLPAEEVPITAITNGVHARSCVAKSIQNLYDRYLGPSWAEAPATSLLWERVKTIPDEELWRNHERCRSALIMFVRERLQKHLRDRGATPAELAKASEVLDPTVLTIGFARRFATYKRATLFLHDLERIRAILLGTGASATRLGKVQFVIAGKAHPKDNPGKDLIRDVVHFTHEAGMSRHVVFVPDYDVYVSRLMVAGCDVWLNTPRRPREASGTSGMKAAMNGLPNLSVLDGWWAEADYTRTGWAIGHGEEYDDPNYQDQVEAATLYNLLEQEIVPLFYEQDEEGLPRGWLAKMKEAIQFNCPRFNTARMVGEYATRAYFPASDRYQVMSAHDYAAAKDLARWKTHLLQHWHAIKIHAIETSTAADIQVNQAVDVKAHITLGSLRPDDVQVELYQGAIDEKGEIVNGIPVTMQYQGLTPDKLALYTTTIAYGASGQQGLSLRILPNPPYLSSPHELGLVIWATP
ncbi:MAG: alpha-glucan family phosphorylase [Leptolyngbyaceae cyanobacterium]